MSKVTRALLSVTNKEGLVEFGRQLAESGVELISTGGTAQLLRESGLAVREVAEITGYPEMLDGRVKTLHPSVAGGILATRSNLEHMQVLSEQGIPLIDMVVVNLYPFEQVASRDNATLEEIIDNIDIGGPTMIRAAAKNFPDVAVVTDPTDYRKIAKEIEEHDGQLSLQTHWRLAQKAFRLTASYDRTISMVLPQLSLSNDTPAEEKPESLPLVLNVSVPRRLALRYGENPHQLGALYASGNTGIAGANKLHGKTLSFNNIVDLDAGWHLVQEFSQPGAAIIKHANPCGCAEQEILAEAFRKALECDPVSAFGSVLAFNREVDAETGQLISELFVEAVAAPGYSPEALTILTKKKNIRLLEVEELGTNLVVQSISGGFLSQTRDQLTLENQNPQVVTQRMPTENEREALEFARKVVKHVKSNAIVYARAGQTVGVGAGQTSRVEAARVGALKAILPLKGTVVGSDAFFPFPDGVEEVASHGVTAIVQPGGSRRDQEVIDTANRLGLAMSLTGVRHFRH